MTTSLIMNSTEQAKGSFGERLNFEAITSPEHESWRKHRNALLNVSGDAAGFRGCLGFAAIIEHISEDDAWTQIGDRCLMPNDAISWASITDIPLGFFRMRRTREVHWATVRHAQLKYGVPCLTAGSEKFACDFRSMPFDQVSFRDNAEHFVGRGPDVLSPVDEPQLFRVFNAVEWAMTSTAFSFRKTWQHALPKLHKAFGMKPTSPQSKMLVFGDGAPCTGIEHVVRPDSWMPRPYLGFPRHMADKLYDRSVRPILGSNNTIYSTTFRREMLASLNSPACASQDCVVADVRKDAYFGVPIVAVVLKGAAGKHTIRLTRNAELVVERGQHLRAGAEIGCEQYPLTDTWEHTNIITRWDRWLPRWFGRHFDAHCRLWFERQMLYLKPGVVHVASAAASPAAMGNAIDTELLWDMTLAMPYYNTGADAFVFPTVAIARWDAFKGSLPGDVQYDLTPTDGRFRTMEEVQRERVQREAAKKQAVKEEPKVEVPASVVEELPPPPPTEEVEFQASVVCGPEPEPVDTEMPDPANDALYFAGTITRIGKHKDWFIYKGEKADDQGNHIPFALKLTIGDETQFYGPRGGETDAGDKRYDKGAVVSCQWRFDSNIATVVRLLKAPK